MFELLTLLVSFSKSITPQNIIMKKTIFGILVLSVVLTVACNETTSKEEKASGSVQTNEELAARGKYLVDVMGCNDCHSPKVMTPQGPVPDTTRLLSGHPADLPIGPIDTATLHNWVLFHPMQTSAVGPWGVSFAANLSSDETGIGNWSEDQFIKAIREGKYKGLDGGRSLLPPMPWPAYSKATDEDLKAIFAYLKTTKPVHNVVPPPIPPKHA
jgi:hypothetical protein